MFIATGILKTTCCARGHANREIFRQFRSLCKHLKIGFHLAEINELLSKIIVSMRSRFHSDMPRLNSLEFSRYLRMDFKDVINKFDEKIVVENQIRISLLLHNFDS